MINFEEELKKFHPSMEVDEVQDAVLNQDLTDMTDIMLAIMKQAKDASANNNNPPAPAQQQLQGTPVI